MRRGRSIVDRCCAGSAAALLCAVIGCAAPVTRPAGSMGSVLGGAAMPSAESTARIAQLKSDRQSLGADRTYVVGEGDVLSVHAFDFEQLNQRARVDGGGTIALPLLGTVSVAGHTVADVEKDLTTRLGEFMYAAHVNVFVEDYRSQRVAVIGAVQKPGLIAQSEGRSSVLDW